ncbi:MAG: T9SS type A sorting domain-containing protein [Bacteroidia bacterium]
MRNIILFLACCFVFLDSSYGQCDGARVSLPNGDTTIAICARDGVADFISYTTSSQDTGYTYILTNSSNFVLANLIGDSLDIDPLAGRDFRIWGVSYVGTLQITPGFIIGSSPLASVCSDISDNYIQLIGSVTSGGVIASVRGFTMLEYCVGDGLVDSLTLTNITSSSEAYSYILTDNQGAIIRELNGNGINFENDGPGFSRIYGLSYTGNTTLIPGQSIDSIALSDACFSLSSNFVTIEKNSSDAGKVYTSTGDSVVDVCVDQVSDLVQFTNTGTSNTNYTYVVTTPSQMILIALMGDNLDFDAAGIGTYRIYGVAHQGVLNATMGRQLSSLNTNCLGISDNYVEVISQAPPAAGMVSFQNGGNDTSICVGDGVPDLLTMVTTATDTSFAYIVTNTSNQVLTAFPGLVATVDFDGSVAPDTCLVYGLSYTGILNIVPGQNLNSGLASGCNTLSPNALTITKVSPDGGRAFALPPRFFVDACRNTGENVVLGFGTTSFSSFPYTYMVTDANDLVLGYSNNDSIDFSAYPDGQYRVWGLSYWNGFQSVIGQRYDTAEHATACFQLSSNPITVTLSTTDGGVLTNDLAASDTIDVCAGDGKEDPWQLSLSNSAPQGSNTLVITDSDFVVRYIAPTSSDLALDSLQGFPLLVWNLNYEGSLQAAIGDTATKASLASGCFDLSDDYITLLATRPDGGRVATFPGGFSVRLCVYGGPASINMINSGTANSLPYGYIVTDTNDVSLLVSNTRFVDIGTVEQQFNQKKYRVYGLSYSGQLYTNTGQRIDTADLTSACFAVSSNFVLVTTTSAEGGTLLSPGGNPITVCPGDGQIDTFSISVQRNNTDAPYCYLITDSRDNIQGVSTSWPIDFDGYTNFPLRVRGLAYTGNLLATQGQNVTNATLADECFSISRNFIDVEASQTDGGRVFTSDLTLTADGCKDGKADEIIFRTTSISNSNYAFFVTDDLQNVIAVLSDSTYDFDPLSIGNYSVYGISYEGANPVSVGQNMRAGFGQGCYSLSSNAVTFDLTGDCIASVCFLEDFVPGNSKAWSVYMKGVWGAPSYNYSFGKNQGLLIIYGNGTARLVGRMVNKSSSSYQWDVDIKLRNKMNWTQWKALGRSYASTTKSFAVSNHPFWDYWELDPTANNIFTGVPGTRLAGKSLTITHRPSNLSKGFQKGKGANDKNSNFGFSGWFYFSGSYRGIGDFNNTITCSNSEYALRVANRYLESIDNDSQPKAGSGGKREAQIDEQLSDDSAISAAIISNNLRIHSPVEGRYTLDLTSINGQKVMSMEKDLVKGANMLPLSHLAEGTYLLRITGTDGTNKVVKLIKR